MGVQKYFPEIGKQYGQWTVISTHTKKGGASNRDTFFNVRCSCGLETYRSAHALENNKTKACKHCCNTSNNVNHLIEIYFNKIKRRAEKARLEFNITPQYIADLYNKQSKKCALTNLDIAFQSAHKIRNATASLDRIDSSLGYIKGNVQWVHKDINFMKGSLSQEKFIKYCNIVVNYNSKCS